MAATALEDVAQLEGGQPAGYTDRRGNLEAVPSAEGDGLLAGR